MEDLICHQNLNFSDIFKNLKQLWLRTRTAGMNYSAESENCNQLFYRPQTLQSNTLICFQRGLLGTQSSVSVMEDFVKMING